VLDDGGFGVAQYGGAGGTFSVPAGKSFEVETSDRPAVQLSGSTLTTVQMSQQFVTYLMYQPPGANSIWVVLERMAWNWGGTAIQGAVGSWSLVAGSGSYTAGTQASPIRGVDCSLISNAGQASPCIYLPTWTDYATDPKNQ
jgi:hypothetical protein